MQTLLPKIVSSFYDLVVNLNKPDHPVSAVAKHIAIGEEGMGFNFHARQIGHSVVNSSPPMRRFFGAASSRRQVMEIDLATRYTLRCNNATIMKII